MSDSAAAIRESLNAGLNTDALDRARELALSSAQIVEPSYLAALACARMGAINEAEKWLNRIDRDELGESPLAVDVWSLAGRIAKERFSSTGDKTSQTARDFARNAIDCYCHAFGISGEAYPAINAATIAMLSGDAGLARGLATEALATLENPSDHWHYATIGEARLILGELDAARTSYTEAYRRAGTKYGDIASMRRQLLLIGSPAALALLDVIPAPRVIAFSGHMMDEPERAPPRFPANLEQKVAAAIRDKLASLGPAIGYSQAACGADILFLEAMQDAGMQTNIVLPFARQDFIDSSVNFAGANWVARFERVLEKATRIVSATEEAFLGDEVLFEHAANLIQGMAFLHARDLSTRPLMLTVREPGSPVITGGTVSTVGIWKRKGGEVEEIDLAALRGDSPAATQRIARYSTAKREEASAIPRTLKSLLFADISGFSKMAEQHTPRFVGMFLEICKKLLDAMDYEPADTNTRGDALFMVFDLPSQAAEYAVRLQQAVGKIDWPAFGLGADTGVRVGLHTGPVYRIYDPVMSKPTYYGTHVNRTARLEPVVQTGHIFVSEAFAASLVADNEERFNCQYIGAMPLAKKFGEARLYRLTG
jgi:class 3 adenylate cyclase/tetratricopeptide (TPR) repeat protein